MNAYRKYHSNHDFPNTLFRQYSAPEYVLLPFLFLPLPSLLPREISLRLDPGGTETKERTKEQRKITRVNGAATRGMWQSEMRRYMCCAPRCCRYPANIYSYDNRYTARGLIAATGSLFQRCKGGERRIDLRGACIRAAKSLFNVWVCSWVIRNFGQLFARLDLPLAKIVRVL